jgi:hypothetical protein
MKTHALLLLITLISNALATTKVPTLPKQVPENPVRTKPVQVIRIQSFHMNFYSVPEKPPYMVIQFFFDRPISSLVFLQMRLWQMELDFRCRHLGKVHDRTYYAKVNQIIDLYKKNFAQLRPLPLQIKIDQRRIWEMRVETRRR